MNTPILRPLGFGEILDGAFTLYRRNLSLFLLTAAIPMLVLIAAFAVMGGGMFAAIADPTAAISGAVVLAGFLVFLVGALSLVVMWGALTRQSSQSYLGQPTSVGDGFRAGLRAFLPLLGSGIVVILAMLVVFIGVAIVMMVVAAAFGALGPTGAVLATVLMAVIWIAIYLGAIGMFFAVIPAVVVEGKGPVEAVSRSFDLARGAVGKVVGLMVVTVLITYLPGMAVMALTGGFSSILDPQAVPSVGQMMTQQLLGLAVNVLTAPFMVSVIVLLYFDRRVRTEALDVQMAAEHLAAAGS